MSLHDWHPAVFTCSARHDVVVAADARVVRPSPVLSRHCVDCRQPFVNCYTVNPSSCSELEIYKHWLSALVSRIRRQISRAKRRQPFNGEIWNLPRLNHASGLHLDIILDLSHHADRTPCSCEYKHSHLTSKQLLLRIRWSNMDHPKSE